MLPWITELEAANVGTVLANEPMAPHTYWKIGGPADALVIPETKEQLVSIVRLAKEKQIPWFVLGKGSNLLVTDKGIRGIVIKLSDALDYARFEDNIVYAGAAFSLIKLAILANKRGLSGLEFAGGIPASIGGAVFMNAGAHGSEMSRILKQAEVLQDNGEWAILQNEELQYSYRHSILQERSAIVTEAVLELVPGDPKKITEAYAVNRERRLKTQPLSLAVAGSVFRNPPGHYAAQLIEASGLKGKRVGGAEISTLHANFIINTGQATAEDVLTLIDHIQKVIGQKYDVKLVPEVLVVGER
ncbi:UDP-N-acetylmuramate dehydrogenase [Paenibacillus senegalensis]|uniref:UDP-N-acetylmuramate dehydrogenase n=1 Tax=Paenibacillus senegalensis TaxID=1465766 RepID=UPI000289BC16|nr:UDP-N-acetylmuramate dehydrogenase [Paenibacillus senegalensis]